MQGQQDSTATARNSRSHAEAPHVARCKSDSQKAFAQQVSAARSQPYDLDVTHPSANSAGGTR